MANYVPIEHLGEPYGEDRSEMTSKRRGLIHKHRKWADTYGPELKYDIGKKRKLPTMSRNYWVKCDECGNEMAVSRITCAVICSRCNNLCKIEDNDNE